MTSRLYWFVRRHGAWMKKALAAVLFLAACAWLGLLYLPEVVSPFENWLMDQGFTLKAALEVEALVFGTLVAGAILCLFPTSNDDAGHWVL